MSTAGRVQAPEEPQYEEFPALPYAGISLRIVAAILDLIVLASIFLFFVSAAGLYLLLQTDWGNESDFTNSEQWTAIAICSSFAFVAPFYFAAFWWWRGQSLGQMAVRIMVTDRDGYHISAWQALLRTAFWPLSVLPIAIGLVPILFDQESRALHDMIAGTVVVEMP